MRRITILGGGVFAPRLCGVLSAALKGPGQIVLHARRAERLRTLAASADARVVDGWSVVAETDLIHALRDADAVIPLIRVGGFAARIHDERFPVRFGQIGDEGLGLGGLANAWRSIGFIDRLAQQIKQLAPNTLVANMMAPLGITTRAFLDAGLDAVGICELPLLTHRERFPDRSMRYAGLNHLGWFWDANTPPSPLKYVAKVFGDGHGANPDRAVELEALSDAIVDDLSGDKSGSAREAERPTPWYDEALAPYLAARLDGRAWSAYANIPNGDLVPELPSELIVEVAAKIDADGVHPTAPGPLPASVIPFLSAVARAEILALSAAREQDRRRLSEAVAALPLSITHLDDVVAAITEEVG